MNAPQCYVISKSPVLLFFEGLHEDVLSKMRVTSKSFYQFADFNCTLYEHKCTEMIAQFLHCIIFLLLSMYTYC